MRMKDRQKMEEKTITFPKNKLIYRDTKIQRYEYMIVWQPCVLQTGTYANENGVHTSPIDGTEVFYSDNLKSVKSMILSILDIFGNDIEKCLIFDNRKLILETSYGLAYWKAYINPKLLTIGE